MANRTDDLAELAAAAIGALNLALRDGDAHHPAGSWKRETAENHLDHLYRHALCMVHGFEPGEDHLTHIVCRAAMYYAAIGRK
jgi:hypothetical protein